MRAQVQLPHFDAVPAEMADEEHKQGSEEARETRTWSVRRAGLGRRTGRPWRWLAAWLMVFALGRAEERVVNVREHGAIGDGRVHFVKEWIESGRYRNLRALQRDYPQVDSLAWSIDEAAFARAKAALPPDGGTLYFPAGEYVAAHAAWTIRRDHVRLRGDGPARTTLTTVPAVAEGLVLSPYRHAGWRHTAGEAYPFSGDSGARGSDRVRLSVAGWAKEFAPGELVFVRNGAAKFDQDYGEFNEVAGVTADGELVFKHPLARDYTLARVNWAGEVAADFTMPRAGGEVEVRVRRGEGFHQPSRVTSVTIGTDIFRVMRADGERLWLGNPGRGNAAPGTRIAAGARIAKSRAVIKLTESTRDFVCEGLRIVGRRKALNLSNSYDSRFVDCEFVREPGDSGHQGGITIDGDDGRFARFERCTVRATPAAAMQFARSFGGVTFRDCRFVDASVVFTEFNFDCEVSGCTFDIAAGSGLQQVIIAGRSCGGVRIFDNRIRADGVPVIFDAVTDIHSQKHGSEGAIEIRDNTIESTGRPRVFGIGFGPATEASGNRLNGRPAGRGGGR